MILNARWNFEKFRKSGEDEGIEGDLPSSSFVTRLIER